MNKVRFSHFEKAVVGSVCEDGSVCLWSVESQRLLTKMTPSHLGKWKERRGEEGGRRGEERASHISVHTYDAHL